MNTARYRIGGSGTQTTGLGFGGETTPSTNTAATEEYNGSAWTNSTNLTTARRGLAGCGTQTAGLGFGGVGASTYSAATEEYTGATNVTRTVTAS
jgi:hypothetical protein